MKLFEILNEVRSDFWPPDEVNPRSADYHTPRQMALYSKMPAHRSGEGYVRPSDIEWERRMKGTEAARKLFNITGKVSPGEYKSKQYNLIITVVGPKDRIHWRVDKFIDYETNIYHNILGVDYQQIDDNTAQAKIYIQAKDQSLLLQAVKGGNYKE